MSSGKAELHMGDCRAIMPKLAASSVDAVVTDPPYEYNFMGKKWDKTGVSFKFGTWAAVLRVAKPGAHLLAFGGTRTYHRLACAIEDGGWEIRDCLMWIYGSGFPKSLDVSKALDKAAGAEREVVRDNPNTRPNSQSSYSLDGKSSNFRATYQPLTAPATEAARQWVGFGTALKPAWESIVLARKPLDGTVAANVTRHGTGALNIDGCRVGTDEKLVRPSIQRDDNLVLGKGLGVGRQDEPFGRWPTNLIFTHHCDCKPIGTKRVRLGKRDDGIGCRPGGFAGVGADSGSNRPNGRLYADADGLETVESWQCVDGCPVRALDAQAGERRSTGNYPSNSTNELNSNVYSKGLGGQGPIYSDSGGASRFYPTFAWEADDFIPYLYCPKANKKDRGEGNTHETVKPNQLMCWLARLVCPPGGIVFDPFMGSGSTGKAAVREGFGFLGIDDRPGNIPLARRRIDDAGP
jgi:DNA modification methylase